LSKKYGELFRFDVGSRPTLVIASQGTSKTGRMGNLMHTSLFLAELVQEAFKKEEFNGRAMNENASFLATSARDEVNGKARSTSIRFICIATIFKVEIY